MQKKLHLIPLVLGLTSSAFAATEFTPFITLLQAEQYCPAVNGLAFESYFPESPKSPGKITGYKSTGFENLIPKASMHPRNMSSDGLILGVQFRNTDGVFGYQSGNTVTCLYSYTGYFGSSVALTMRSK